MSRTSLTTSISRSVLVNAISSKRWPGTGIGPSTPAAINPIEARIPGQWRAQLVAQDRQQLVDHAAVALLALAQRRFRAGALGADRLQVAERDLEGGGSFGDPSFELDNGRLGHRYRARALTMLRASWRLSMV